MPFRVEITRRAEADALEAADYIAQDSRVAAARWFAELYAAIESLGEMPERHAVIPELGLRHEYRSLHHYSHRVVYRVDHDQEAVYVVRIYHGARRALAERDVRE
ncbi:type II toxin-antitoxin system RelE/ParE family toxin [bacterium]|nr:MAG: type II toxin-antitoxin system RelE/ParE family toxin [bacterium]